MPTIDVPEAVGPADPLGLREGFARLVARTGRQWRRAVDVRLHPFGLTEATWLPLLHLSRAADPMRQKDLAAALALDGSSVVRLLDALQGSGLITRQGEAADRRANAIVPTERGRETAAQVEVVSNHVRRDALAGLTDAEIETATKVLRQVCLSLAVITEPTS